MAEALEEANQGLTRTLKDLFAGAVGGVAQVLIGMSHMLALCEVSIIFNLMLLACPAMAFLRTRSRVICETNRD